MLTSKDPLRLLSHNGRRSNAYAANSAESATYGMGSYRPFKLVLTCRSVAIHPNGAALRDRAPELIIGERIYILQGEIHESGLGVKVGALDIFDWHV